MFLFAILSLFAFTTSALDLGTVDVKTYPTQTHYIASSSVKTSLISQLKKSNELVAGTLDDSHYQQIMNQIAISSDVNGGFSKSMQWEFKITRDQGILRIIDIEANVKNGIVTMYIDGTQLTVSIPTMYENHRTCARTGNRKYGVCGPRTNVCHDNYVVRGLNSDEIRQVSDHLVKSIPKKIKTIRN